MSLQGCQASDTTGFPVTLSQSLYSTWPLTNSAQDQLKKLTSPPDFTIQWSPSTLPITVSVTNNTETFQIRGFNDYASQTSLTLENGSTYTCSQVISVTQALHRNFCQDSSALYEAVLAFQIRNKSLNPKAPDIILMCRPIVFSDINTSPFWKAVNLAASSGRPQSNTPFDISQLFAYNHTTIMPMMTYRTCMPVKLLNYNGSTPTYGSISIRVHVVPQPIYMVGSDQMTAKCSVVSKYSLITEPSLPTNLFQGAASNTVFQFKDGLGTVDPGYPNNTNNNFIPLSAPAPISAFQDVMSKFEIFVPEAFLGKSISEISSTGTPAPSTRGKKAYKCYKIDPNHDIKNGQILIDPATGQSLSKTLQEKQMADAGYDPALLDYDTGDVSSGLMPGDIQQIMFYAITALVSLILLAYLLYILHLFFYIKDVHHGFGNLAVFAVLLTALTFFGIYFEEKQDKNKFVGRIDPNRNGVGVGATNAFDPNRNGVASGATNAFDPNRNGVASGATNAFDPNRNGIASGVTNAFRI